MISRELKGILFLIEGSISDLEGRGICVSVVKLML
jgi:hypothetical protein